MDSVRKNIQTDMKRKAKDNDFKATLWLVDVKRIYEQYEYNLGYIRGRDKKPRINRPAIVVDKQGKYYRVFFLTSSKNGGYKFKTEICKYQYCTKDFRWESSSRIFIKPRKKGRIKFIFLILEADLENLMEFCGPCREQYIENIADKNKKKKKCLMKF